MCSEPETCQRDDEPTALSNLYGKMILLTIKL